MTRRNATSTLSPRRTKKSKRHARRVKQAKMSKLTREILAGTGSNPVVYADEPPQPNVIKVDLRLVRFDESYQRGRQSGIVRKIATEFNHGSLGLPVVVQRADGLFYVIDGRQRITAIMERNKAIPGFMTHVWCELVLEKDAQARKEAKIFMGRNQRANMSLLSMFKAAHKAKDPAAVDIIKRITAKGLSVEGVYVDGALHVKCVSSIKWAHKQGVLEDAIDTIKGTWGLVPNAFKVMVFFPIAALLCKNRSCVSIQDLIAVLSATTPAGLDAQAGSTNGRMRTVNIANFIVDRYNRSVPKPQRIDHVASSDL